MSAMRRSRHPPLLFLFVARYANARSSRIHPGSDQVNHALWLLTLHCVLLVAASAQDESRAILEDQPGRVAPPAQADATETEPGVVLDRDGLHVEEVQATPPVRNEAQLEVIGDIEANCRSDEHQSESKDEHGGEHRECGWHCAYRIDENDCKGDHAAETQQEKRSQYLQPHWAVPSIRCDVSQARQIGDVQLRRFEKGVDVIHEEIHLLRACLKG
ncbi:hypothetical protein [Rathayibacter rathayi]|uniref:hypothetical protein n=1 Tax=Rathayibacter rathayi TaxID=33887 RepID=UPI0015E1E767|nr:hypothetical protein [Rathayibacter rathayi]